MHFNPENPIVKLCGNGMMAEGEGNREKAHELFLQAWNEAANDFEKSIAAHYVSRHQPNSEQQLRWNELALQHALKSDDEGKNAMLPSLYLNVGKDHEDRGDAETARSYYEQGLRYAQDLADDGYGQLVVRGLKNGLERVGIA